MNFDISTPINAAPPFKVQGATPPPGGGGSTGMLQHIIGSSVYLIPFLCVLLLS